ncbi:MAG TPA: alkaline phosphatase family protein [Gammaproteobacteria bacterium]|nr:alkaline phosphatase family protein [Gammaproteobacteria bacterium]
MKDRSAVFAAGLQPDDAYWYDERTGNFVTSDYYRDALPVWVDAFNAEKHADAYFGTTWSPLFSAEHYLAARLRLPGRDQPTVYSEFPHLLVGDAVEPDRRYYTRLRVTPYADELTLAFTRELIESEQLGRDADTDLIVVGLSAADYIGHRYGPWSEEVHDFYARLDTYLGEFLRYLDERLGSDRHLIVLTADHGVMPFPERIAAEGRQAGRMDPAELLAFVEPVVAESFLRGELPAMPTLRYEQGVIFDFGDATVTEAEQDLLARAVAARLEQHPFVVAAYTHAELRAGTGGDSPWFDLAARSFYPDWSPDVVVVARENYLITEEADRAVHGSPYAYDSQVPLIFMGPGITAGERDEPVRTVDVAPTLASLLGVEPPADLDGRDLSPSLRARE